MVAGQLWILSNIWNMTSGNRLPRVCNRLQGLKILESIKQLMNRNEEDVTGYLSKESCGIGMCFGQSFLPLPCFLGFG